MYMQVESHTGTFLHLKRNPSIRSWSLLVVIFVFSSLLFSPDTWTWKLFYIAGCVFVAIQNMEEWEEAIFDKKSGKAILKTFNLYKKILTLCRGGHEQVVVSLKEIRAVNVEEEKVRYFGKGYVVILRFVTGISHPLTQSAVLGGRSDVEAVAKLLTGFLDLDMVRMRTLAAEESSDSDGENPDKGE
uniref:Essential for reactive oxygen species protein n=1 Tax=Leptobrachium leishanense TaxID=445787 RepID=A0A8C5R039_9ANUR